MKANYQSITTRTPLCKAVGQSIVECRLSSSEVANILHTEPTVALQSVTCDSGEVGYTGKLTVSFLYESTDGRVCRAERGAEFRHKAEHPTIAAAHEAVGKASVLSVKTKRDGNQLVAVCVVESGFTVYGEARHVYLTGGEDVLVRREEKPFCSEYVASAETDVEDDFECDFAQDVLMHAERALVTDVRAGVGEVEIRGEICLNFCASRADGSLCVYERFTPFTVKVPMDVSMPSASVTADVTILSAQVSASTDEGRGNSRVGITYRVEGVATVYECQLLQVASDAYSTVCEVGINRQKVAGRYALSEKTHVERVYGSAILSSPQTGDSTLLTALFPKAVATVERDGNLTLLQGVIECKAIFRHAGGGLESTDVSLPFAFPVDPHHGYPLQAPIEITESEMESCNPECAVYGFTLRMRSGGEAEAECTLKVRYKTYAQPIAEFITELTDGEKKQEKTCAFSVYLAQSGDDLWSTAKRLSLTEAELQNGNPHLTFPLKGEERLFVYRQKRENLEK